MSIIIDRDRKDINGNWKKQQQKKRFAFVSGVDWWWRVGNEGSLKVLWSYCNRTAVVTSTAVFQIPAIAYVWQENNEILDVKSQQWTHKWNQPNFFLFSKLHFLLFTFFPRCSQVGRESRMWEFFYFRCKFIYFIDVGENNSSCM